MIQDIFPHKLDNQYRNEMPTDDSQVLCVNGYEILASSDTFPTVKEVLEVKENEFRYLFSIDDQKYFMPIEPVEAFGEYEYRGIRGIEFNSEYQAYAAYTAKHLTDWYRDTKFCGRCGKKLIHDNKERCMKCPDCGNAIYPRIMPAVIVGVKNNDKLLLTKYNRGYGHNALIAGFTEIGETVEETVAREVMEEAGIKVKNITYYKSQPWGIANDILLGYYCEVDGDTTITMDSEELKYAEWVKREDIILQPNSFSLTNEMMKMFKEGKI